MRPLVNGQLHASSQANANQLAAFITAKTDTFPEFDTTEPVTVMAYHGGLWLVNFSILADTVVNADDLYDFVVGGWTSGGQANRILVGSTIKRTNNYDDEGNNQPDEIVRQATK